MRGIELGRSIGSVAAAPKVAMSMAARSLARDFAPIKIANRVNNISPLNTREVVAQAEGILGFSRPASIRDPNLGGFSLARSERVSPINIKPEPKRASRMFTLPARILNADYIAQSSSAIKSREKAVPRVFAAASQLYKVMYESKSQPVPAKVEQEVEDVVEELVQEKREIEDIKEDEDVLELKKVYLEDEEVQEVRQIELKTAIRKAFEQALKYGWEKITGEQVARFLPQDHEGNRSQIVKKQGPDGTNLAIKESASLVGDIYTEEGAQQILDRILEQNKPVRLGKNSEQGRKVSLDQVKRVLRFKKVSPATFEYVTRIVKKRQLQAKVV